MPPLPSGNQTVSYVGIDPGKSGGCAVLNGSSVQCQNLPVSELDLREWIAQQQARSAGNAFVVIERQTPRPTFFQGKSSILKSTVELYGNYMLIRGMLTGLISYEEVLPKRWQQGLRITPRQKSESDTQWKNRLKGKAQQLFPHTKVTLATADALLLAEYGRRLKEGGL